MADRFWAQITIGGPIDQEKRDKLAELIDASRPYDDISDDNGWLMLSDSQARYGAFEFEEFCEMHDIPFDRDCEAYCEYDGECAEFRVGMKEPLVRIVNASGFETISMALVRDAIHKYPDDPAAALEMIKSALSPEKQPLPPMDGETLEYLARVAEDGLDAVTLEWAEEGPTP